MATNFAAASFLLVSASSPSSYEDKVSKSVRLREDWRNRSKPIHPGGVYPAKEHCSRCGLCDTYYIAHVRDACAFLGDGMSRIEALEPAVHGRERGSSSDEIYFGVHEELIYARKIKPVEVAADLKVIAQGTYLMTLLGGDKWYQSRLLPARCVDSPWSSGTVGGADP